MSPKDARCGLPMTHGHHQKKKVMKAVETYTSNESSDDEFLAQSNGHLRVKNVRKGNSLNVTQSIGLDIIQERVSQLEKELEAANELTCPSTSRTLFSGLRVSIHGKQVASLLARFLLTAQGMGASGLFVCPGPARGLKNVKPVMSA